MNMSLSGVRSHEEFEIVLMSEMLDDNFLEIYPNATYEDVAKYQKLRE